MNARKYFIFSARQHAHIYNMCSSIIRAWAAEWFVKKDCVSVTKVRSVIAEDEQTKGQLMSLADVFWCHLVIPARTISDLGLQMFQAGGTNSRLDMYGVVTPMLREIVMLCQSNLVTRLAARGGCLGEHGVDVQSEMCIPSNGFKPGTGCLVIECEFFTDKVLIALSPSIVEGLLSDAPQPCMGEPLTAIDMAIGSQLVPIEVHLSSVELDLESLYGLKVGDVIRLDHEITQPATMAVDGRTYACSGYLGKNDGCFAMSVLSERHEKSHK